MSYPIDQQTIFGMYYLQHLLECVGASWGHLWLIFPILPICSMSCFKKFQYFFCFSVLLCYAFFHIFPFVIFTTVSDNMLPVQKRRLFVFDVLTMLETHGMLPGESLMKNYWCLSYGYCLSRVETSRDSDSCNFGETLEESVASGGPYKLHIVLAHCSANYQWYNGMFDPRKNFVLWNSG